MTVAKPIASALSCDIPDTLKEDILIRDIIFESNIQIKRNTQNVNIYSETELLESLNLLSKAGFVPIRKVSNPLKGPKYIVSSGSAQLIVSVSTYTPGTFLCVIAQIE